MDPSNRSAYTFQWNGNVQHTFSNNYLFEVAYTGSRSYNEHKRYNINQAFPGTTAIATRVPYPAFQSAILYSSDAGWARFNGVSFRLEKRYADGLFFLANYQVSKSIDNGSGEIEANDTADARNLDFDEGYARYDQRHRSVFSFGYELPFGPGKRFLANGGAAAYVFGGWQVQGIVALASGFPLTVTSTNVCMCGNFVPQRVNLVSPGQFGILDNPTPTLWFDKNAYSVTANGTQGTGGRNTIRGPGTQLVNFSISKRFPINRARLEFRAEVFNLLNHNNFGNPDTNISNATVAHDHDRWRGEKHAAGIPDLLLSDSVHESARPRTRCRHSGSWFRAVALGADWSESSRLLSGQVCGCRGQGRGSARVVKQEHRSLGLRIRLLHAGARQARGRGSRAGQ